MPKLSQPLSPFRRHVRNWENCQRCPLHTTRKQVVLVRGTVPAEVVFIGEAPGPSENTLGEPFKGPAGHLLDKMIRDAIKESGVTPTMCFTNIVACIPISPVTGRKKSEPVKAEIDACEPRLEEFFAILKPKLSLIVAVGTLSAKQAKTRGWYDKAKVVEIVHPSFILQNEGQQWILIEQTVVRLTDAFVDLIPF